MNQDQRKFLIEQVVKTYRESASEIENKKLQRPSLNNYLVAACLDDTIKYRDIKHIREKVKKKVLSLGKSEVLVSEIDDSWKSRKDNEDEIKLNPADIFIFPDAYIKAMEEYTRNKQIIDDKLRILAAQKDTIILKIQVGSAASLEKLVSQIDNIADLSLVNNALTLAPPGPMEQLLEQKQLPDTKIKKHGKKK